jgi:hypothetical protein
LRAAAWAPLTIWEIQLTRIAVALGDENLAGNGAARRRDGSRGVPTSGSGKVGDVRTQKDRAEEKRREKLADIQDQVDCGKLTIRQMTPEERRKNPPKRREPKRSR